MSAAADRPKSEIGRIVTRSGSVSGSIV